MAHPKKPSRSRRAVGHEKGFWPVRKSAESRMRTGKEIILATKPYAVDSSARSWAYLLSTALLLAGALAGTLWNFHLAGKMACSLLAGLLYLRFFVIYHDQQHAGHIAAFPAGGGHGCGSLAS